jgi:hypothetical protein
MRVSRGKAPKNVLNQMDVMDTPWMEYSKIKFKKDRSIEYRIHLISAVLY